MRGVGREKALGTGGEEAEAEAEAEGESVSGFVEGKVMGLEAEQPIERESKKWVFCGFSL